MFLLRTLLAPHRARVCCAVCDDEVQLHAPRMTSEHAVGLQGAERLVVWGARETIKTNLPFITYEEPPTAAEMKPVGPQPVEFCLAVGVKDVLSYRWRARETANQVLTGSGLFNAWKPFLLIPCRHLSLTSVVVSLLAAIGKGAQGGARRNPKF
jgi:hypothetical protein